MLQGLVIFESGSIISSFISGQEKSSVYTTLNSDYVRILKNSGCEFSIVIDPKLFISDPDPDFEHFRIRVLWTIDFQIIALCPFYQQSHSLTHFYLKSWPIFSVCLLQELNIS